MSETRGFRPWTRRRHGVQRSEAKQNPFKSHKADRPGLSNHPSGRTGKGSCSDLTPDTATPPPGPDHTPLPGVRVSVTGLSFRVRSTRALSPDGVQSLQSRSTRCRAYGVRVQKEPQPHFHRQERGFRGSELLPPDGRKPGVLCLEPTPLRTKTMTEGEGQTTELQNPVSVFYFGPQVRSHRPRALNRRGRDTTNQRDPDGPWFRVSGGTPHSR